MINADDPLSDLYGQRFGLQNGNRNGQARDEEIDTETETPEADQEVEYYLRNDNDEGDSDSDEDDEYEEGSGGLPAEQLLALSTNANMVFFKDQYKTPHASIIIGETTNYEN